MFDAFAREFRPGPDDTVIDVGVTPDETLVDSNAFEQFYPYTDRITATSFEDASGLEKIFPGLTFVQTSGTTLPFADGTFTFAYSSAVLEHVGDFAAQQAFVREVMRVADAFFIAVPNRWFPLELHTFLPVIHWLPKRWHRAILQRLVSKFELADELRHAKISGVFGHGYWDVLVEYAKRSPDDVLWLAQLMQERGSIAHGRSVAAAMAGCAQHEFAMAYAGRPPCEDLSFIAGLAPWVFRRS